MELEGVNSQFNQSTQRNEEVTERLTKAQDALDAVLPKLEAAQADLAQDNATLAGLREQISKKRSELENLEQSVGGLNSQFNQSTQRNEEVTERLTKAQDALDAVLPKLKQHKLTLHRIMRR